MADLFPFLTPFTIPPLGAHTHTLIFLHGRGDQASTFAPAFTEDLTSTHRFPGLKLVFPTPREAFSTCFRMRIRQWFDFYAGTDPQYPPALLQGLRAVVEHLHELIQEEVAGGLKEERILLGGISQGCAAALVAVLFGRWRLGGVVCISGWLPFAGEMRRELRSVGRLVEEGRDVEVPEWREEEGGKGRERIRVLGMLKERVMGAGFEEGEVEKVLKIPVWVGHGDADNVVRYPIGREIYGGLKALGMEVEWRRYVDMSHWYQVPEEIDDIIMFWEERCGLSPERPEEEGTGEGSAKSSGWY